MDASTVKERAPVETGAPEARHSSACAEKQSSPAPPSRATANSPVEAKVAVVVHIQISRCILTPQLRTLAQLPPCALLALTRASSVSVTLTVVALHSRMSNTGRRSKGPTHLLPYMAFPLYEEAAGVDKVKQEPRKCLLTDKALKYLPSVSDVSCVTC